MTPPNTRMIEQWNLQSGSRWVARQPMLDRQLGVYSELLFQQISPGAGSTVLDLGCGCGATTLGLAQRVTPSGKVVGVDVSVPMLARAQQRLDEVGYSHVELQCKDAQVDDLGTHQYNLVVSRFGVMFFDDPFAGFVNVRKAMCPGARLVFVCWRTPAENPWATVPFEAAMQHLPRPEATSPDAPGPFAFANRSRIEGILATAGFQQITITPHDTQLSVGGGVDLDATTDFILDIGPVAYALRLAGGEPRDAVAHSVRAALTPYAHHGDVRLAGATWLVTAVA
jgi:SAM-dependent methyltransferase